MIPINDIWGAFLSLITSLLIFLYKKVYYINHKISEMETHLKYLREDIKEIKEFIKNKLL